MSFENRFARRAVSDPADFERAVTQRFGFDSAGVGRLLEMASKLSQSGQLSGADIRQLQALHPSVSKDFVATVARRVNEAAPDRRFELFAGVLANDQAAMFGNHVDAGSDFKAISDMTQTYTTESYAAELNARRGGSEGSAPWRPEPGSARDLIERQLEPPGVRELADRYEAGDEDALETARQVTANSMERSLDRLAEPDISTRDAVEAALAYHSGEQIARTEFGVGSDE
jgi:hypothetical protein